jgi:ribosomal protein RSM22 (predicted rRNA methylase)
MAKAARNFFGETLPEGALSAEEFSIYKTMYGEPSQITTDHLAGEELVEEDGNVLLRDNEDGTMDEFQVLEQPEEDQVVDEDAELEEEEEGEQGVEIDGRSEEMASLQSQVDRMALQSELEGQEETALTFGELQDQSEPAQSRSKDEILDDIYDNWPEEDFVRSHPYTEAGKFGTKPSTLQLPHEAFVKPVQQMLAQVANKHLSEAAQKSLGGVGIPDSPSTPAIGRSKGQRPIPLTAMQGKMSPMEANVFVSSIMPQVYASVVSVLVECRKRMGKEWLRDMMKKEGGPLVLDAGAGGAGIMAFREILRAEWESTQDEEGGGGGGGRGRGEQRAEGQKKLAPVGRATVVTGSDSLRLKASTLLENTTFVPRLPDYVDPTETESNVNQPRKRYDIIIAPHTLWPLLEEHERKTRTQTLWSLLNPNGGLLILIEKGVPRGFEVVAGARDLLLKKHIASPGTEIFENTMEDRGSSSEEARKERYTIKEKGSIIAPCTNHTACPLYPVPGVSRGRKDWCFFQQRYTRPSYLMSVLQAKARNHDDVEFSYLAVQRGVDIRESSSEFDVVASVSVQGSEATEKARKGYGPQRKRLSNEDVEDEHAESDFTEGDQSPPHPLSLPRILPGPLKRKGHILLDVCTPSGTYERWMVRKGMGKQVFRDARKAKWGDLWAMGASSSEARRVKLGTPMEVVRMETKRARERAKGWRKGREGGKGKWRYGGSEKANAA